MTAINTSDYENDIAVATLCLQTLIVLGFTGISIFSVLLYFLNLLLIMLDKVLLLSGNTNELSSP